MSKNWYVVHTYSGFEKFVSESIRQRAVELNIDDLLPLACVVESGHDGRV